MAFDWGSPTSDPTTGGLAFDHFLNHLQIPFAPPLSDAVTTLPLSVPFLFSGGGICRYCWVKCNIGEAGRGGCLNEDLGIRHNGIYSVNCVCIDFSYGNITIGLT